MQITICKDARELGKSAATSAAELIRRAIAERGHANVVLASGSSQRQTLTELAECDGIDWGAINAFHLDEYVSLKADAPGSARAILGSYLLSHLPESLRHFHQISAERDPYREAARLCAVISEYPIDVCLLGIGENGHLAFNDPPADFELDQAYHVVQLDEVCRRQQITEGWFQRLEDVPYQAISMSIRQILRSRDIVISVPDLRKAAAVLAAVRGPVDPRCPASILQRHAGAKMFLDQQSAALLRQAPPVVNATEQLVDQGAGL